MSIQQGAGPVKVTYYVYVNTVYADRPTPAGWHGGAYSPINKLIDWNQLKWWGIQAAAWSRTNLTKALAAENPPRQFNRDKWLVTGASIRTSIPAGTPRFLPPLAGLIAAAAEKGGEGLEYVDGAEVYEDAELEELRNA